MGRSYKSVLHRMRAVGHAKGLSDEQINQEIEQWKAKQAALYDINKEMSALKRKEEQDIFPSDIENEYNKYDIPPGIKSAYSVKHKDFYRFMSYNGMNPADDVFDREKFNGFMKECGYPKDVYKNKTNEYLKELFTDSKLDNYPALFYTLFYQFVEIVKCHNDEYVTSKYKYRQMKSIEDKYGTNDGRIASAAGYRVPDFDEDPIDDLYESIEDGMQRHLNELSLQTLARAYKKAEETGDVEMMDKLEMKMAENGDIEHIIKLDSGIFKELHLYVYWADESDDDYGVAFELYTEENPDEYEREYTSFSARFDITDTTMRFSNSFCDENMTPDQIEKMENPETMSHLFSRKDAQNIADIINSDTGARINWRIFYTRNPFNERFGNLSKKPKKINEMSDGLLDRAAAAARKKGDEERARKFEEYKNSPDRPKDEMYADEVQIGEKIMTESLGDVVFGVTDTEDMSFNKMRVYAQILECDENNESEVQFINKDGKYCQVDINESGMFVMSKGTLVSFVVDKDDKFVRV